MNQGRRADFFNLTYPSNRRNPAIVDCLKLCENEQYGRHVVTTRKLSTGDVVAIEKPFYKSLDKRADPTRCANCLQSSSSALISCTACSSVKFCSEECKDLAWEEFHKHECDYIDELSNEDAFLMSVERSLFKVLSICGSLENLEKLVREHRQPMTVFDIDLSESKEDVNEKLILVCQSLESAPPTEDEIIFATRFVTQHEFIKSVCKSVDQENFLINFVTRFIGILNRNSFTLHWPSSTHEDETGCGIFPFACLLNHSCSPNLIRICVDGYEVFIARHPIEADEQLFISYHQLFYQTPLEERQLSLYHQFNFICCCVACENDYPLWDELKIKDENFTEPADPSELKEVDDAIKKFKENCKYIDNNFGNFPCYEICRLFLNNYKLLKIISK